MSEKPPRPINPVEDTSSTVPPTESTPETPKPAGAEFEPVPPTEDGVAAKTKETVDEEELFQPKKNILEEMMFEEFLNKRGDGLNKAREFLLDLRTRILESDELKMKGEKKTKSLDTISKLENILDSFENHPNKKTSQSQRARAERALKFLYDAGVIGFSTTTEEAAAGDEAVETDEVPVEAEPAQDAPEAMADDKTEAQDEKTKIYDDPNQDPAVQETESRATRIANERIEAKRAQGSKDADSFDFGMRMHNLANMQAWDTFATLFPQKAAAYKDKIEGLKDALGRKANREEKDARDAAKASKKADPKVGVPPIDQTTGATGSKTSAGSKKKEKAPEPPDVFEPLPSTDPSDWEAILGVSRGATKEELRNAYRRLSQKYHPDKRNGHPQQQQFEEAFKVVNAAYANAQGKGKKSRYAPPPPSSSSGSTQTGGHAGGHGAPPPPSGAGRGPHAAGGGAGGPTGTPPPPGAGGPTPSGAPKAARGPGKPKTPGAEEFKVFSEKFQSDLKISEKDLKTIPGYEDLTFGQRALVQERFKQVMLGKIREDANSERKEQQANAGRLGKFVGEFLKTRRIAELEKAVAGKLSEGGIDMHRATLEQLVAATKANKDEATLDKEGDLSVLNISYTSGLKAENPEQARQAALFDEAASKLSQIPSEWGAESATRAQKAEYEKTRKEYDTLR
ncbi:MAG: molecular chaperone DnaJ, partial [Patescibacteria group bacterium]|nr:molecular chaperone DnaJ [Patescibacteria group bacterium]